jgi:hypothetical protein
VIDAWSGVALVVVGVMLLFGSRIKQRWGRAAVEEALVSRGWSNLEIAYRPRWWSSSKQARFFIRGARPDGSFGEGYVYVGTYFTPPPLSRRVRLWEPRGLDVPTNRDRVDWAADPW